MYKDDTREEIFVEHQDTIFVEEKSDNGESQFDPQIIIIPVVIAVGVGIFLIRRKRKQPAES